MTFLAALALAPGLAPSVQITPAKVYPWFHPLALAAAPTGTQFVATLEDGSVRVLDAKTGGTIRNLAKHVQPAYAVDWSRDGRFIATGDETARVFIENALTGEKMREYRTHGRGIQWLSFNLPRTMILTTGRDDQIHVLDLNDPKPKQKIAILGKGSNFFGATFNPTTLSTFSTAVLVTGGGRQYDAISGKTTGLMTGHDGQGALSVAYNPAATLLATGGKDGNVAIYMAKSLGKMGTLKGHTDWVVDVAFSPSGQLLATSSTDRTVKVWDVKSMQKVADLPNQSAVGSPLCFTSDSQTLVTVNDAGYLQVNKVVGATPPPAPVVKPPVKPATKPKAVKKKKKPVRRRKG